MTKTSTINALPVATILGDSRVFDTYYLNDLYPDGGYGYQATFPFLLRRMLLSANPPFADSIHIPDHFRGRTLQNNIIRLALTDPAMVVIIDGIWETLLSPKHLAEHAQRSGRTVRRDGDILSSYGPDDVVRSYARGELTLSPTLYADRICTLTSYFVRRRRQVVWMTTPIPPLDHRQGLHYAGAYRPIAGWHGCLEVLNEVATAAIAPFGAHVVDLNGLMAAAGGATVCLLDQWHFTPRFHALIADNLLDLIAGEVAAMRSTAAGPSRNVIVPGAKVDPASLPNVRVLDGSGKERDEEALRILASQPNVAAVVYPEELNSIDNPVGDDRKEYGLFG